jgi:hypothetical protein
MTTEDHVAYALRKLYLSFPRVDIISFHPPSGKAYETPLVRFPVIANIGIAARRRHLDFIVRCGRFLILQELKGDAASSHDDQVKLLALQREFGLPGIIKTIAKRIPTIQTAPVIDRIILSLGFSVDNEKIPDPFSTFCVDKGGNTSWRWSSDLTNDEITELQGYFTQP